eukprot:CAMPEP_0113303676 /NCGR_PEP_ID=MMETSP0010_2-20120614/3994_1 /TAXON_ID=216773 ORGANISM="Corethron hystrix, Strain 308" /NCGR_SAMPLE_ID=MMETSP0010_2 /ASSEMBLY_ACC=CAM_ASM_000155 /LENGTH=772 /DNA_ID=CAMNT_0000157715 /DNA_START=252 /DNA_END=2567 /DNA_ORIENTATION=- /assembly_acc=CAM_ASM_000155
MKSNRSDLDFNSTIENQWLMNSKSSLTAPYIVCDTSNYVSKLRLQHMKEKLELQEGVYEIVYNGRDASCFVVSLKFDQAFQAIDFITVTPMSRKMKMGVGTLSSITGRSGNISLTYNAIFCPSVSESLKNDTQKRNAVLRLQNSIVDTLEKQVYPSCNSRLSFVSMKAMKGFSKGIFLTFRRKTTKICIQKVIDAFASHSDICSLNYERPNTLKDFNSNWIMQGGSKNTNILHSVGILGQGQVAQISDSGCSVNSCYFYDPNNQVERNRKGIVNLSCRKIVQYFTAGDGEDNNSHGTHVASIIAGNCSGCEQDDANGVAPEAKLAIFDILNGNSANFMLANANKMFGEAIDATAFVHSASWGPRGGNPYYSHFDRDWDNFIYHNEHFLVFKAAGNDGYRDKKFSLSGAGKNIVTVCATNNYNVGRGENYIAWFSSRGPTKDDRIKPDVCGPGHKIQGAGRSIGLSCYKAYKSGTSMATPGVAGAALLIRQYFSEGFYPSGSKKFNDAFYPTGTLIKAVLVNSGRALLGVDNGESRVTRSSFYDMHQGFGRISLIDSLYLEGKNDIKMYVVDQETILQNEEFTRILKITECGASVLSATLVWADKANGSLNCGKCLVNSLHLTIEKQNKIYFPNGLSENDDRNNVQRIRIPTTAGDSFKLKVEGTNLYTESQTFSLVVTGCFAIEKKGTNMLPCFDGYEYFYNPTKLSWDQHSSLANEWGGHLASVHDFEETNFVMSLVFDNSLDIWMGGRLASYPSSIWQWSDGSKWNFTNW